MSEEEVARSEPYCCDECLRPARTLLNVGQGRSDSPEVTYVLICERCWGPTGTARQEAIAAPKPDAPVVSFVGKETTEEAVETGAEAIWNTDFKNVIWEDADAIDERPVYLAWSRACLIAAYKVDSVTGNDQTDGFLRGPVHGMIQTIRGMCTDELGHMVIDRKLVELDEMVWDFVYPGRAGGVCPDQGGTEVCDDCQPDCPCHGGSPG